MHKLNLDDSSTVVPDPEVKAVNQQPVPSDQQAAVDESYLNDNNGTSDMKKKHKLAVTIGILVVVAGIATGYGGYKLRARSQAGSQAVLKNSENMERIAEGTVKKGDVFGVQDEKTFKDSAEGYLEIGGMDGEGSHKLLRPGGDSQTVYLTSSITDLDKFDGMEVKIWGETFKGQSAGWLMDVGRVEVVNPEATPPSEE